ncbi:unnamed protein product [Prorocentrum cordatum]|uniref:Uncharacterized protein n=1 Tax=Prorocentrum cordatum TaxID=2364126 RepID=A0ABN9V2S3_9DINO|nr:unnamed protein product [Polarella glacialis]
MEDDSFANSLVVAPREAAGAAPGGAGGGVVAGGRLARDGVGGARGLELVQLGPAPREGRWAGGLGSDGLGGAAPRRRGPRRAQSKAAAELDSAPTVAAPEAGGSAASGDGLSECFALADGLLRQAPGYGPQLSAELRQVLESVSWRPASAV